MQPRYLLTSLAALRSSVQVTAWAPVGNAQNATIPDPYGSSGTRLLVRTAQAGPLTLTAYDATGRRLFSRSVALPIGATTLDLPEAGHLPVGMYHVQATQAGQHAVLKLLRE